MYLKHRLLLLYIATRKFGVPDPDAEAIVQEAVLALLTTGVVIDNPKAWLVAVTCNGCRAYWRRCARKERTEHVSAHPDEAANDGGFAKFEREILVQRILSELPASDRHVLRLRYFDELTAAQIAVALSTTTGYAEKLISKALRRARQACVEIDASPPSEGNRATNSQ